MKKFMVVLKKLLLTGLLMLSGSMIAFAADDFCWKDSYGRGVGEIPTQCTVGKDYQAGLCYESCKTGFSGEGPVCWSSCPSGYRDMGAICHIDKKLLVSANWSCAKKLWGKCIWPRTSCPDGYTNAGAMCGLTSAGKSAPPGFSGTFLDPVKSSYGRGVGTIPTNCNGGDYDAGLCYSKCRAGYAGVGPVCWGEPPPSWVQCGMGAAKSSSVCRGVEFGQVASVAQLAWTIGTLGAGDAVSEAATEPEKLSKLASLEKQFKEMKAAFNLARAQNPKVILAENAYKAANSGKKGYKALDTGLNAVTPEDMVRMAAQIAAIMDPSGVSDTVASYTYPKCSKLFTSPVR